MPREKLFEAINANDLFMDMLTGGNSAIFLDMYEVTENYVKGIISVLKALETGKTVCYEHSKNDTFYRWQKKGRDSFALQALKDKPADETQTFEVTANTLLNKLFEHAPFMGLVGTEQHMNLSFTIE